MVEGGNDERGLRTEDGSASSGEKPAYSLYVNDLYSRKEGHYRCLPKMLIQPTVNATGALYFSVETMNA